METSLDLFEGVPAGRSTVELDVRELPPPEPLTETMERVASLGDNEVLLQVNDRLPQHLFPRLEENGFEHESRELDEGVVTAIWSTG
ncbi:MAG: DUF2249 domain-containing protein [Halodesulfurarchaeum sp.]